LNRNITVGAMSFDLTGADTGSALLTIATGTGSLLASGEYITLDFANAEAATTYLVVSNSKAIDLGDFYVDSAQGSLSLGGDGTSLYFTSVPEPAEWAAIFGALALGLALYARRRR